MPRDLRDVLRDEAETRGLSLNAYVLWLIAIGRKLLRTGKIPASKSDPQDIAKAFATFANSRVPNNVNQIAKAMNSGSFPATPETEAFIDKSRRNPRNFDLETYQKAKRERRDPGTIVMQAKEAWSITRSPEALSRALESRGLYLARGDRRAAVVMTYDGEIHSLGRLIGRKAKDLKERFGEDFSGLRSVEDTQKYVRDIIKPMLGRLIDDANKTRAQDMEGLEREKVRMREQHRIEREQLDKGMAARQELENWQRAARIRKGLPGIWDRATGAYARIRAENEREAMACLVRDRQQRQSILTAQIKEREVLQEQLNYTRSRHEERLAELHADLMRQREGHDRKADHIPDAIKPEFTRAAKPDFDWQKSRRPFQEREVPKDKGHRHER